MTSEETCPPKERSKYTRKRPGRTLDSSILIHDTWTDNANVRLCIQTRHQMAQAPVGERRIRIEQHQITSLTSAYTLINCTGKAEILRIGQ